MSTVLITGASGGLGRAFAHAFAKRGHDLLLCSSCMARCEQLRDELRCHGVQVRCFEADLSCTDARDAFWAAIDSLNLRLNWIVNVAGMDIEGMFTERCSGDIRKILRINNEAAIEMTLAAYERRGSGEPFRIVFISSLAACQPMPYKTIYAASKRFLLHFAVGLSEELRGQGATVTAVCPSGIPTSDYWKRSIESQGFWGRATSRTPAFVAEGTIRAAQRGAQVYIPGWINVVIARVSAIAPASWRARFVAKRWAKALDAFHSNDRTKE